MIHIDTEKLPPPFHWDPRTYFRGTEEFYVETAESMVRQGEEVVVWMDRSDSFIHNGVHYMPRSRFLSGDPCVLSCNHAGQYPEGVHVVNWTNFAEFPKGSFATQYPLVLISEAHRDLVKRSTPSNTIHVIGHGLPPHFPRYDGSAPKENLAVYTSSPDRGGKWLEAIWPQVEKETGTRLVTVYGGKTRAEMVDLYTSAKFWIHPGAGVELFCLSGQKALAAGCYPIYGVGAQSKALEETIVDLSGVCPIKMAVQNIVEEIRRVQAGSATLPLSVPGYVPTVDEPTNRLLELLKS
jgi:hypothetical protein